MKFLKVWKIRNKGFFEGTQKRKFSLSGFFTFLFFYSKAFGKKGKLTKWRTIVTRNIILSLPLSFHSFPTAPLSFSSILGPSFQFGSVVSRWLPFSRNWLLKKRKMCSHFWTFIFCYFTFTFLCNNFPNKK